MQANPGSWGSDGNPDNRARLFFDVTKACRQGHSSGLNRVSRELRGALSRLPEIHLQAVRWSVLRRSYVELESGRSIGRGRPGDAFFTPETFALEERWFCRQWLSRFRGKSGVVYYDAIPHLHPETTWPHSVKRFPKWFAALPEYDQVFFISEQSRREAQAVGHEFGITELNGSILLMGSDYQATAPRIVEGAGVTLLQVGIIEPRKGQDLLLGACERLWSEGHVFKLVLLGRFNPHFRRPLEQKIADLCDRGRDLVHETSAGDDRLAYWHARASLVVQPSRAEGFGLPVLEALWTGCPVLCSVQPCLESLGSRDGIQELESVSLEAVESALRELITEPERLVALRTGINPKILPTWANSARRLCQDLGMLPV